MKIIWGDQAQENFIKDETLIVKEGKLNEFNGQRNIINIFQTQFITDVDKLKHLPEFKALREWKSSTKISKDELKDSNEIMETCKASKLRTLEYIEDETLVIRKNDKIYNETSAYLVFVKKETLYYLACPNERCSKKVLREGGSYHCDSCNENFKEPRAKYIIQAKISDCTNHLWVTFYDLSASQLLNCTADELRRLREDGREEEITSILRSAYYKEVKMKIMSKIEKFKDDERVRHQVIKVYYDTLKEENHELLKDIEKYIKY